MPTDLLADVPADVLDAIAEVTGPVVKTERVGSGFNSEIAARVHTGTGTFFVKGLRTDHSRVWTQQREAEINPHLQGIAPRPLRTMPDRMAAYSDTPELFAGDRLLHTDWNNTNVLVHDGHALLVNWAWASRGAGWIDPPCG